MSGDNFQRNNWIDVLRGVAILMILLLHAIVMTPEIDDHPWILKIGGHLAHGVQLFFLISGWVITVAYERGLERGYNKWDYLLRRAAKIFPLYFIFLNLGILFYLFSTYYIPEPNFFRNSVSDDNLNISNYLLHIFMLQGFSSNLIHTLLDGSWSIVIEVYFYILFPFLIYRFTRKSEDALFAFFVSLVVSISFTMLVGKNTIPSDFGYYAFPVQLPCFLLGIYCCRVNQEFNFRIAGRHAKLMIFVLGLLFFGLSDLYASPLGGHIVSVIIFGLALLFVRVNPGCIIWDLLRTLGRQSYALFFLHLFFLKIFFTLVVSNGILEFRWVLIANIFVSVFLSFIFSWLIFDRIDQFFVKLVARRFD